MNAQPPESPFGNPPPIPQPNRTSFGKGVLFGCGGCALVLLGIIVVSTAVSYVVLATMGRSDAVTEAIKRANASAQVEQTLGTPVVRGWFASGNLATANGDKSADVRISVNGPKAGGILHAVGCKRNGEDWVFTVLEITVSNTGERIDLLPSHTIKV